MMQLSVPKQWVGIFRQTHLPELLFNIDARHSWRHQRRRRPIARRFSFRLGSEEVGVVADGQLLERAQWRSGVSLSKKASGVTLEDHYKELHIGLE